MNRKEDILKLLEYLKAAGISRAKIESDLDYSENYINQQLAKGGNERLFKALTRYRNDLVHGQVAKSNYTEDLADKKNPETFEDLRAWQTKYIQQIERENERLLKDREKLEQLVKDNQEIIKLNLTMVLGLARTLSARQIAHGTIILGSLERLEKKKKDSLVVAADNIIDQIEEESFAHGKIAG